jgi:hypothetical protein
MHDVEKFVAELERRGATFDALPDAIGEYYLNTDDVEDLDHDEEVSIRYVLADHYEEVRDLLLARETRH